MVEHLFRRFRKEIRENPDIQPGGTVVLCSDPEREANTRVAEYLLGEVFGKQITITHSSDGLKCGSRQEAGLLRLMQYTRRQVHSYPLLLKSLLVEEIQELITYADLQINNDIYLPSSPEQQFVSKLGEQFPDVLYGL